MNRLIAVLTVLAVAVGVPPRARAQTSQPKKPTPPAKVQRAQQAKVLRAKLAPVREDVAAYGGYTGKAQLVINKRNAKVSLHLKGLVPGATYTWALLKSDEPAADCSTGTAVPRMKYKRLKAGPKGNANSTGFAKKFALDRDATYQVAVYQAGQPTEVLLCGTFKAKSKKAKKKPAKKHSSKGKARKG
jgi:hypothetical protein